MASKRQHMIDYAEDSYTDEEDEMELDHHQENRPKAGRPRKTSATTEALATQNELQHSDDAPVIRRRGRGPSKRPCLNRNALMARENRQRKKEYIERIEKRLQACQKENSELNATIKQQSAEIKKLSSEVSYLKTVLNNQSQISSLLQAMNESLRRMHGNEFSMATTSVRTAAAVTDSNSNVTTNGNGFAKASVDVLNWVSSGQTNSSKTNNVSLPPSGSMNNNCSKDCGDAGQRSVYGQMNNAVKVARKTIPFNSGPMLKVENSSNAESIEEEEKRLMQKSSPQSDNCCEYQIDRRSSAGLDNQLPTTPMSALSSSLKNEASLSDTDFSQLSSFNVDLFDNFENEVVNPLQFDQDTPDIFNEDTLFHTLNKEQGIVNKGVTDPLEISRMSDALNEKTLFNSLENTGVCLHINSNKVSLEYCSICHLNSLNNLHSDYL